MQRRSHQIKRIWHETTMIKRHERTARNKSYRKEGKDELYIAVCSFKFFPVNKIQEYQREKHYL